MQVLASRVLLTPRDLDASLAFYEGVLGLHRFREFGGSPPTGVVLFLGGGYLELVAGGDHTPPQGVRLWLQTPDVRSACDDVEAAGHAVTQPPTEQPWGLIEAVITDPDGLELVFVEVPDDHPLRRDVRGDAAG